MSIEVWLILGFWILAFGGVICGAVERAQTSQPSKKPVTAQEPTYVPRHNAKTRAEERSIEQAWVRQFSELQIQRHKALAELSEAEIDAKIAVAIRTKKRKNIETSGLQ